MCIRDSFADFLIGVTDQKPQITSGSQGLVGWDVPWTDYSLGGSGQPGAGITSKLPKDQILFAEHTHSHASIDVDGFEQSEAFTSQSYRCRMGQDARVPTIADPSGGECSTVKITMTAASGNINTAGTITAATGSAIGNLTLANGSITDSGGEIDFGDELLTTTGKLTAGTVSTTRIQSSDSSDIAVDGTLAVSEEIKVTNISSSDSTFVTVNDGLAVAGPIKSEGSIALQLEGPVNVPDNLTAETVIMSQLQFSDSSVSIDTIDTDSAMQTPSDNALVTQKAVTDYVATQIAAIDQDLFFSLNTTGLSNSDIASLLNTLAPNSSSGTKARIAGVSITASSSSTFSPGAIGFAVSQASVSTSTTLNHTRNNDLIFTRGAGSWAYTSG